MLFAFILSQKRRSDDHFSKLSPVTGFWCVSMRNLARTVQEVAFYLFERLTLAFCRPVPFFCGAAEVLWEGCGLAV